MGEFRYSIIVDNICMAKSMNLEGATLFVKALFEKNYTDKGFRITIQRDDFCQEEEGILF